jgi:hypothetical protein
LAAPAKKQIEEGEVSSLHLDREMPRETADLADEIIETFEAGLASFREVSKALPTS